MLQNNLRSVQNLSGHATQASVGFVRFVRFVGLSPGSWQTSLGLGSVSRYSAQILICIPNHTPTQRACFLYGVFSPFTEHTASRCKWNSLRNCKGTCAIHRAVDVTLYLNFHGRDLCSFYLIHAFIFTINCFRITRSTPNNVLFLHQPFTIPCNKYLMKTHVPVNEYTSRVLSVHDTYLTYVGDKLTP